MYTLFLTKNTKNDKFFLTITDKDTNDFFGSQKELELIGGDNKLWRKSILLSTYDFKECANKYRLLSRKTKRNPLCFTIPNDFKEINPNLVKVKKPSPLIGRTLPEEVRRKMSKSKSGKNHPKYDHTIYTFYHAEHGEVSSTRYDLSKTYNIQYNLLHHIVKGNTKMVKGWSLDKEWVERKKIIQQNKNKPKVPYKHSEETKKKISQKLSTDTQIYTFYNKEYGFYHCTRYALCKKFDLNSSNIKAIVDGSRISTKGWTVIKTL